MSSAEDTLCRIARYTRRSVSIRPDEEGDALRFRAWVHVERATPFAGNKIVTVTGFGETVETALVDLLSRLGAG
jgi:hypothetical protein